MDSLNNGHEKQLIQLLKAINLFSGTDGSNYVLPAQLSEESVDKQKQGSLDYFRNGLISTGWRPKDPLVNFSLDVISYLFADYERKLDAYKQEAKSREKNNVMNIGRNQNETLQLPVCGGGEPDKLKKNEETHPHLQDPEATSISLLVNHGEKSLVQDNPDDSASSEEVIFSPSLMNSYKNKLKSINKQKTPSPRKNPPNVEQVETSPTPEKHELKLDIVVTDEEDNIEVQVSKDETPEMRKGTTRRNLNLEYSDRNADQLTTAEMTTYPLEIRSESTQKGGSLLLEESLEVLEPTPPTQIKQASSSRYFLQSKKTKATMEHQPYSEQPVTSTQIHSSSQEIKTRTKHQTTETTFTSSESTVEQKKGVWRDPDRSFSHSNRSKNKSRPNGPSASTTYKQPTLITLTRKMPRKTVDLSTCKEFNGGSRHSFNSQQTAVLTASSGFSGIKRKSDETAEPENSRKTDKIKKTLSDAFGNESPIKPLQLQETELVSSRYSNRTEATSSNNLKASTSTSTPTLKLNVEEQPAKLAKKQLPLSPGKSDNILYDKERSTKLCNNNAVAGGSRSGKSISELHDSTLNHFKDFDKIPKKESPQPKYKYKQPVVRKKAERNQLQGWDCEECKGYYELLASQLDESEIQKIKNKCSRHRAKSPVANNTPEDFWCTYVPENTQEFYKEGYIKVASTPFTPPPRRRRRRSSESSYDENNVSGSQK